MASKKKNKEMITSTGDVKEEIAVSVESPVEQPEIIKEKTPVVEEKKEKKNKKGPKYPVGSIVYVSKDTLADLNGFNLSISQYKRDTYTVEAYDDDTGVYKVRHLKLLLHLKEADLMAPDENAHDPLSRKQF